MSVAPKNSFDLWLVKQGKLGEGLVSLQECILSNQLYRYVMYRSKFFVGRLLIVLLLQSAELWFLAKAFSGSYLTYILALKLFGVWLSSSWWGGIEVMRSEIRELSRDERTYRIPDVIQRWMVVAITIATPVLVSGIALMFVGFFSKQSTLFVGAVLLVRLAIEVVVRTFHSGAYAIRRIYRPMWAVLGVEVVGFAVFIYAARVIAGPWAAGIALLFNGLTNPILNFFFVRKVYDHFGFWPLNIWSNYRQTRGGFKAIDRGAPMAALLKKKFWRPAAAYSLVRLDAVAIVTALAFSSRVGYVRMDLALTFYLFSPLIISGHDWGQLLYFDFKRLELGMLKNLRKVFEKSLRIWPVVLGLVIWAMGVGAAHFVIGTRGMHPAIYLGPLILAQSVLGYVQVRSFSNENYRPLFWVGTFQLVAIAACTLYFGADGIYFGVPSAAMVSIIALSFWHRSLNVHPDRIQGMPKWLASLRKNSRFGLRVGRFRLVDQENNWHAKHLLKSVKTGLRRQGEVALLAVDEGIWFERAPSFYPKQMRDLVLHKGAGWVANVRSLDFDAVDAQPAGLAAKPFFNQELRYYMTAPAGVANAEAELVAIQKDYPNLIVVDVRKKDATPQGILELSAQERGDVYLATLDFIRELHLQEPTPNPYFSAGWVQDDALTHVMFFPLNMRARKIVRFLRQRLIRLNFSEVWLSPSDDT